MRFDNAKFDVVGDRDLDFADTMRLVFQLDGYLSEKPRAKAYEVKDNIFSILWHTDGNSINFPTRLEVEEIIPIAKGWLDREAEWDAPPDHDGHNKKGWRIFQSRSDFYTICSIEPCWTMYGK